MINFFLTNKKEKKNEKYINSLIDFEISNISWKWFKRALQFFQDFACDGVKERIREETEMKVKVREFKELYRLY